MTSVGVMASSVGTQGPAPAVPILVEDFDDVTEWVPAPAQRTGYTGIGYGVIGSGQNVYTIPVPNRTDTITFGFRYAVSSVGTQRGLLFLRNDGTVNQFTVVAGSDNSIRLTAGGLVGTIIASSAAGVLAVGVWVQIDVRLRMHDTLGFCELWINGVLVSSATNIDTKQTSTSTVIETFELSGGGSGVTNKYDDLYLATDGGAVLGAQRVGAVTDVLAENFNNLTRWTTIAGAPSIVAGRNGNGASLVGVGAAIEYPIASTDRAYFLTLGFAIKPTGTISGGTFMSLRSDAGATQHLQVQWATDGSFQVFRGASSSIGVTAPAGSLPSNVWSYFEMQALLHDTAGAVTIRVNGAVVASAIDVDTRNAGTLAVFDSVRLNSGSGPHPIIDDLRLRTGTLADFLGDVVVP